MGRIMNKGTWLGVIAVALLAWLVMATPYDTEAGNKAAQQTEANLPAAPGVPTLMNFQGQLTNPLTGNPVADGSYSVRFSIWDSSVAGTEQWNETQSVTTTGGLFSVLLGSVTPLSASLFDDNTRYLEVKVGTDPAMTPRQRLAAGPYAFHAVKADSATSATTATTASSASDLTCSGCVASGEVSFNYAGSASAGGVPYSFELLGFGQTSADTVGNAGYYSSLTIGTDGLPIIVHYDSLNTDLRAVHCGNAACTAGNTVSTINTAGGMYPSVAIGADGLPVVAYSIAGLVVTHCGNAACSAGNTTTTFEAGADPWVSMAIGPDGLPVIAYSVGAGGSGDLKVAHCGNATCTSGNVYTTVDSVGDVGYRPSLAIGVDGLAVMSYYDATTSSTKLAHCGNLDCSAGNTFLYVAGPSGLYSSITVGANGLPIVAYRATGATDLVVVTCGNVACAGMGSLIFVDSSAADVGYYPSIALGRDALPVISYYDSTNGDLKVAHCGSSTCSGPNSLTSVDTVGDVGNYTSITIGQDGLPVVSYYDSTNGDLKVTHCSSEFCVPYQRRR